MTAGTFLLARPFMGDPNFERTVVLVCSHSDEDGTFGLVLNRVTTLTLADVLVDYGGPNVPLAVGGPVQPNTLHYLHRVADLPDAIRLSPTERPPAESVYWGGDFGALLDGLDSGRIAPDDVRFYVGYSGWSNGQLEAEIADETWVVRPDSAEKVFTFEAEALWRGVLLAMGGKYRVLANYPIDPSLN